MSILLGNGNHIKIMIYISEEYTEELALEILSILATIKKFLDASESGCKWNQRISCMDKATYVNNDTNNGYDQVFLQEVPMAN